MLVFFISISSFVKTTAFKKIAVIKNLKYKENQDIFENI